jgi:hypothetical protein
MRGVDESSVGWLAFAFRPDRLTAAHSSTDGMEAVPLGSPTAHDARMCPRWQLGNRRASRSKRSR